MSGWTKCLAEGSNIGDRSLAFAFIAVGSENNDLLVIQYDCVRKLMRKDHTQYVRGLSHK